MACKVAGCDEVKRIVIELDVDFAQADKAKVWAITASGKKLPFEKASDLKKAIAKKAEPPKFKDATSITLVRTNPCGWVYIGGKWYYKCW